MKTAGGNGTKMPKPFLSETTLCSGRLSTIIILRKSGNKRESFLGSLTRVPHSGLWDTTQSWEISTNIISFKSGSINEKAQEFRGHSALLIGIKEERLGKHLQLTSAFSNGNQIPHWVNVPWKHPTLRTKKQSAKIKPLKSHRHYRTWVKNQGALLPWVKHDKHSTEKKNLAQVTSNAMFLHG